jgi:hypothetical protein
MFSPTRDQVRQFFCGTFQKLRDRVPLAGNEAIAAAVIEQHPELHALLADADGALAAGASDAGAQPFLHLSLHLAIAEQLSIDQPPGIRAIHQRLCARFDAHSAEHRLLDCLAETIWQAQQERKPPDGERYLERLKRSASA